MEVKLEDINLNAVPRFFFEGNQLFDWIDSPGDFHRLEEIYDDFYNARSNPDVMNSRIEFGFRREHTGSQTLGEFLNQFKKG